MPEANNHWRNPMLKPLPKYVHGEFKTLERRKKLLEQRVAQLKAIEDADIDISKYYEHDPINKYYDKWLQACLDKGMFYKDMGNIYVVAYQSCWPEESPTMIFQYLKEHLNVRFKWFAKAEVDHGAGSVHLRGQKFRTIAGAIPNINGCYHKCAGDYGEKFNYGSRISKLNELYNYASSPNLRECGQITCNYAAVATAAQYCQLKIKRGAEEETTTIADLWIEMLLNQDIPDIAIEEMRSNQCSQCRNNRDYVSKTFYVNNGEKLRSTYQKLLQLFNNDIEKIKQVTDSLDDATISLMVSNMEHPNPCYACAFRNTRVGDEGKMAKDLVNYMKGATEEQFNNWANQTNYEPEESCRPF